MINMDEYDKILNFYNSKDRTEKSTVLWCNEHLVKLMQTLLKDPENSEAENCITFIMNLFFIEDPDHYHTKGKRIDNLNQKERRIFQKLIRNVYYNN